MARNVYSISFANQTVSDGQDLFQVLRNGNVPIFLHDLRLGQTNRFGDANAAHYRIRIGVATGNGSGGSSANPEKHGGNSSVANAACEVNNTVVATGFTAIIEDTWNIMLPYFYMAPWEDDRIQPVAGQALIVNFPQTPSASLQMSGTLTFSEIK